MIIYKLLSKSIEVLLKIQLTILFYSYTHDKNKIMIIELLHDILENLVFESQDNKEFNFK